MATRPTADRIKESVFNILGRSLQTKRVLDLFAGTGALGIEALSRGASSAVFVDQAKAALSAIRYNIREMELEDRTRVIHWNILKNLNCLTPERDAFDLVFMDPPYETNAVAPTLAGLLSCGALTSGARVVIEHSSREPIVHATGKLVLSDQRRFGKTLVSFMDTML
jgi:16S rRNA (guanine966-N2)-methyltransferase